MLLCRSCKSPIDINSVVSKQTQLCVECALAIYIIGIEVYRRVYEAGDPKLN